MRDLLSELKEAIIKHSTFFTIAVVLTIIFVGLVSIENPDSFLIASGLAVVFWVFLTFLAVGREALKGIASIVLLAITVSASAFIGVYVAPYTFVGPAWVLSTVGGWSATLALSYIIHSNVSRWIPISISSIIGFISTYAVFAVTFNISIAAAAGLIIQIIAFILFYRYNRRTTFSSKKMPSNAYSENLHKIVENACRKNGWEFSVVVNSGFPGDYFIIWDEKAYVIYPVNMDEQFSFKGKRQEKLAYKDKDISPWLSRLAYSVNPSWKSKKADVGMVLLDVKNGNGRKTRLIGTSNSFGRNSVCAILPGEKVKNGNVRDFEQMMNEVEKELGPHITKLSEIQYEALKSVGIRETINEEPEDSEISETSESSEPLDKEIQVEEISSDKSSENLSGNSRIKKASKSSRKGSSRRKRSK